MRQILPVYLSAITELRKRKIENRKKSIGGVKSSSTYYKARYTGHVSRDKLS